MTSMVCSGTSTQESTGTAQSPPRTTPANVEIVRSAIKVRRSDLREFGQCIESNRPEYSVESRCRVHDTRRTADLARRNRNGRLPGLEQGGYAMDTLTLPDSTPVEHLVSHIGTRFLSRRSDGAGNLRRRHLDCLGNRRGLDVLEMEAICGRPVRTNGRQGCRRQSLRHLQRSIDSKLHDLNGDGEADFYESFSADSGRIGQLSRLQLRPADGSTKATSITPRVATE